MAKRAKSAGRSGRRREEIRRALPKRTPTAGLMLERPEYAVAASILAAFVVLAGLLVAWGREQATPAIGRIMEDTRLVRVDYTVADEAATEQQREEARASSPRVYRRNVSYLDRLRAALEGLPVAAFGRTSLDEMSEEIVAEYALTAEGLAALQRFGGEDGPRRGWTDAVRRLIDRELVENPIIVGKEYQNYIKTLDRVLVRDDRPDARLDGPAVELDPEVVENPRSERAAPLRERIAILVQRAGFPPDVASFVVSRLMYRPQETFVFDAEQTLARANEAAAAIEPVLIPHRTGEIIHRRGERLTPQQYQELLNERAAFDADATAAARWLPRIGAFGAVAIVVLFLGSFLLSSYPRVLRNPLRTLALVLLVGGMAAASLAATIQLPKIAVAAAVAPTLFTVLVVRLAYDRRLALFTAVVQSVLVALGTQSGPSLLVLLLAGAGTLLIELREVRHRNSIIRASAVSAAVLVVAAIAAGLLSIPPAEGLWLQVLGDALGAGVAALAVGFLVLGILPSIERLFGITTGMTLAELRDPSQPLLRELQQRAPGTYNHSLQVANIAESAADAIGADSLLLYVGALYHDVGKMNKPEYFVENQAGGPNKHDKLRPAMSLLVIIGHVKDGIELAREYGLPREIIHFIESHHGTTLVEYFYHAARERARERSGDEEADRIDEVEFRYPGPRPRTKEAAILMLSDAVESATRAMSEPHPSRIEALVREMAQKRLLDGQFDECPLTFRELRRVEDAIIQRLCAIYHGRIKYPKGGRDEQTAAADASAAVAGATAAPRPAAGA